MKSFIKKVFVVAIAILCFLAAKIVVQPVMNGSRTANVVNSIDEESFKNEVSENGIDSAAGKKILGSTKAMLRDTNASAVLAEAYGEIKGGTTKEIRSYLNSHPERKSLVGNALVTLIREGMDLPIKLDEYTSLTGLHYSESAESVVYHYTIENEFLKQFDDNYDTLKTDVAEINPDATCKMSLGLLGQGFDMTYSYRNSSGKELFSIVRTYEDCERMGFNKYS